MSATTDLIHRLTARGLSQMAIERRTGIPQPRISRWAAGRSSQSADDALKLRDLLDSLEKEEQAAGKGASHAA